MPTSGGGAGTDCDRLPKKKRTGFDEDDTETKCDEQLILGRPAVVVADECPLHHRANQHDEQGAGYHGDYEGVRIGIGKPARVATEHEHGAVCEVEDTKRTVDDRQA